MSSLAVFRKTRGMWMFQKMKRFASIVTFEYSDSHFVSFVIKTKNSKCLPVAAVSFVKIDNSKNSRKNEKGQL
jgi:hypothetical protein